ncbi:hypothetical protein DL767_003983 [Monosporascus sp. MG133]|nr:hypothetical protein DL767_003983 [Monosporascus sp. MG133]
MHSLSTLLVLGLSSWAAAVPAAPLEHRASSCTFKTAAAAAAGKKSCTNIVLQDITVPAGQTLDLTKLKDGTTVTFAGKTTFGYKEWEGPLISVSGKGIAVKGASGHVIDANGAKWWDGKGSNGGKKKPKFFFAHGLTSSSIVGLNVKNTPVQGFSINGVNGLTLKDIHIDNSAGNYEKGGHNTDAFDVGSSDGVKIIGAVVKNQDDCLAINSGKNIEFTGGDCSGGHGISIGSVGGRKDNVVQNVVISNSKISNSDNGVRIKTVYGATGSVDHVTYSNVQLSNINKYGIVIQQDYENGSPTGKPTNGVPITRLTLDNITGSVTSKATPVQILCGKGSCSGWGVGNVKVSGGKKSSKCQNVPKGISC